jgi:hypothetical protein
MKQFLTVVGGFVLVCCASMPVHGQQSSEPTYEEMYDEPYTINKLFIGFQPFYGEVFATNVNAGYGLNAQYFYKTKFHVTGNMRKTYSSRFFDFNRELAYRNRTVSNKPEVFNYYEIGGTYHIRDFDTNSTARFFLRSNKKLDVKSKWAHTIPQEIKIPSKLRQIIGARAGLIVWNSTVDINRALEKQGLTMADLATAEGNSLPGTYLDSKGQPQEMNVYSSLFTTNLYIGGSITLIRNVAIDFDNFTDSVEDGIVTYFLDVIFAPSARLDPVLYNNEEYSTRAIRINKIGVRAGLDGKFNRKLSWGYGGEIGYRPSIDGRGFFALLKISFPVYSTNLEPKVKQE